MSCQNTGQILHVVSHVDGGARRASQGVGEHTAAAGAHSHQAQTGDPTPRGHIFHRALELTDSILYTAQAQQSLRMSEAASDTDRQEVSEWVAQRGGPEGGVYQRVIAVVEEI